MFAERSTNARNVSRSQRPHEATTMVAVLLALAIVFSATTAMAQGSIHGTIMASAGGSPADGEVSFVGYLDDSDDEIRIESCLGAGYETGHWFDDFQNYLAEAPGVAYDYHFYVATVEDGFVLSGLIPDNSFQEENVELEPVAWPTRPTGLSGSLSADSAVLNWTSVGNLTYHVYRREAPSGGSLFRIDVLPDNTNDPGVSGSTFTDYEIQAVATYDYVLIAEDGLGQLSPHSDILTVSPGSSCCVVRGDVDHSGSAVLDISDLVYLNNFMFQEGPEPPCLEEADVNGDGSPTIDISDLVYLVSYMFQDGPPPSPCP